MVKPMISLSNQLTSLSAVQQRRSALVDGVWYGVIIFGLWLLEFIGVAGMVRGAAELVVNPLLEATASVVRNVELPYQMARNSFRATKRIQDLELRYSQALAELGELQALQTENQALRSLLENSDRTLADTIVTRPIVSFAHPTVGVGQADGINEGALILVGKTVVGTISEISDHTAKVNLLFQQHNSPIVAKTEAGVEGVVVGDGKRLLLTEVPRDAEVIVGQRVVTVGQPGIPADLFLGQVVSIETDPADPVKQVAIEQLVDFYQAPVVEVVQ